MANLLAKAIGNDGQLELYEDRVVIIRKGFLAMISHGIKGKREIPLSSVASVELKPANFLSTGYINFVFSGGETKKGENKVVFTKKFQPPFENIKEKIFQLKHTKPS